MSINKLYVNGVEVSNIFIDTSLSFNRPAKVVNTFSVPGRNGDLIVDEGVYENVVVTYPAYFPKNSTAEFPEMFQTILNQLAPLKGYQRIETAWDPTHYRLGRFMIPQTPTAVRLNRDGFFDMSFDCKPQRFLTSGETATTFTSTGTITNPTAFPSQPLIRIYGNGTATIGNTQITLTNNSSNYTDIDCEMMDCFRGTANRNQYVSFTGHAFPVLEPGSNQVTLGSGITRVEITPRWWEL